jgi:hypothetical protein
VNSWNVTLVILGCVILGCVVLGIIYDQWVRRRRWPPRGTADRMAARQQPRVWEHGPLRSMHRIGRYGLGPRIEHIPEPDCPDCFDWWDEDGQPLHIKCAVHDTPDVCDDLHLWDSELRELSEGGAGE